MGLEPGTSRSSARRANLCAIKSRICVVNNKVWLQLDGQSRQTIRLLLNRTLNVEKQKQVMRCGETDNVVIEGKIQSWGRFELQYMKACQLLI